MNDEYISREAVLKHLNECRTNPLFDPEMARMCFAISVIIEDMQATDVQPVKHGEWKINSDGYYPYCSVCGTAADQLTKHLTKYCPECGARMDGGDKDDS